MRSTRVALLPCLLIALAIESKADARNGEEGWVPSLSLSFDTLSQRWRAAVSSSDILGPPLPSGCNDDGSGELCSDPGNVQPLTSPVRGGDTAVAALVGLSVELMTPSLLPRPGLGRPRLFAHAGVAQAFPFQRNIAGEGDPGRFRLPPPPDGGGDSNLNVTTISGQGSRAFSELQSPVVSAGAGVAFAVDAFNRRFRVKPSFEYLRQIVELEGAVHRVVQLEDIDDNESFANFRRIGLSASKTVVHHGIGGGLELEADASRVGPLALTVFVRGRVYQLLGDLDETLTASNEFQESATWRYEPESLVWRGAAGLRFRFVGSSE